MKNNQSFEYSSDYNDSFSNNSKDSALKVEIEKKRIAVQVDLRGLNLLNRRCNRKFISHLLNKRNNYFVFLFLIYLNKSDRFLNIELNYFLIFYFVLLFIIELLFNTEYLFCTKYF